MTITKKSWSKYIAALRRINDKATESMMYYIQEYGMPQTPDDLSEFIYTAFNLSTKYGEAASALACEMYDAAAIASGVSLAAAEPAPTATYAEVAKAINGTLKTGNAEIVSDSVGRMVKLAGVDTTLQNAVRDGAEFAWIPVGDTCPYCITLAALGWRNAGKKTLRGKHAEHVHANCDCTYAIRFNGDTKYDGYDPDYYDDMIRNMTDGEYDADSMIRTAGRTSRRSERDYDGLNMMRRSIYEQNKDEINAQKRSAYAKRKERESSKAEEIKV